MSVFPRITHKRRHHPLVITPTQPPVVPDKAQWLTSEFLKTRVANGLCSRHLAADACAYANVCETCENFVPTPEFIPSLRAQLADIRELRRDARSRGWASEVQRHGRVTEALEAHPRRLESTPVTVGPLDTEARAG